MMIFKNEKQLIEKKHYILEKKESRNKKNSKEIKPKHVKTKRFNFTIT